MTPDVMKHLVNLCLSLLTFALLACACVLAGRFLRWIGRRLDR